MQDGVRSWPLQVLVHEILAPSEQAPPVIRKAVLPKVQIIFGLVAGGLGLPPDHPSVQRAVQLVMLLVMPAAVRQMVLPAVGKDPQAMLDDVLAYVFAGLGAIRVAQGRR